MVSPIDPAHDGSSVGLDSDTAYPHGHIGNLTQEEQATFDTFKRAAEERGLYDPTVPSHRDEDLLRYLRARKWVVADGLQQLADTTAWRQANDVETLYRTIDLDAFEQSRRLYPQWTGRRDRRGIPLYIFDVHALDSKTVSTYEKACAAQGDSISRAKPTENAAPSMRRLFALYENLTKFVLPFSSQLRDREHATSPISNETNIVDVTNVGLKQFWNLKAHMQAASIVATAHYPETLDRIYIVGAPFFFPTVWGWVKKWFDPATVSKIFILADKDVTSTLTRFIAPENLPRQYGGTLDWSFGDQPASDPAWNGTIEWAPGHDRFISSPCVWEEVDGGARMACIGVGSVNGQQRRELICTVDKLWSPKRDVDVSEPVYETNGAANGTYNVAVNETQNQTPYETYNRAPSQPYNRPAYETYNGTTNEPYNGTVSPNGSVYMTPPTGMSPVMEGGNYIDGPHSAQPAGVALNGPSYVAVDGARYEQPYSAGYRPTAPQPIA